MIRKNLTKKDIIKDLTLKTGFPFIYSKKLLSDLIEIIIQNIKSNNFILKNIGSFKITHKKERIGRNPKNKQEFIISARKSVSFGPSKKLSNQLNEFL